MNIYLIEGPANVGKSSLILAQYKRLMNTKKYTLVENENPHTLDDFRFLIEENTTKECILFNSPTDDNKCITAFDNFINSCKQNHNVITIVSSIRSIDLNDPQGKNTQYHDKTINVIKKHFPGIQPIIIDLLQLLSIG